MSTVEVYYDESLPITADFAHNGSAEPHILLHVITQRRGEIVYVLPIGAWDARRRGGSPRNHHSHKVLRQALPGTQLIDTDLLPLLPSWVPVALGRRYNARGTFRG